MMTPRRILSCPAIAGVLAFSFAAVTPLAAQSTVPTPNLTSINPNFATVGASGQLQAFGSGFLQGDRLVWTRPGTTGGVQLSTQFFSGGELRADVPANLVTPAGVARVQVFYIRSTSQCANGCLSNSLNFQILDPLRLSRLTPDSGPAGAPISIIADGTGFGQGAYLLWRRGTISTPLSTNLQSSQRLLATVPASLMNPEGTVDILVINGTDCNGPCEASNALPFRITASLILSSITPNRTTTRAATGASEDVVLAGVGFASNAKVIWRAGPSVVELSSQWVSANEIVATIPPTLLTAVGTSFMSVRNPGLPGVTDQTSNELPFLIDQGLEITRLDPASVTAGSGDTLLAVSGLGFSDSIRIRLQTPGGPQIVPAGQIFNRTLNRMEVPLAAGLLAQPLTYSVVAFDSGNLLRVSNSLPFTVTGGARILSLTPPSRVAGSGAFPLVIAGTGFTAGSRVLFGTRELIPTSVIVDRIEVPVPADALVTPGLVGVKVRSLLGAESNTVNFTVAAQALITTLNPASRIAGSGAFTLTVLGSGFLDGSRVLFGPRELLPTLVSADRIVVPVPADAILAQGTIPVKVRASDLSESNAVNFTVAARALITSLMPPTRPAGSGAFTLSIAGSGFTSGSTVVFGTREFIPSSLTQDRIGVTIPADAILNVGIVGVKVRATDETETNTVDFGVVAGPVITSLSPPNRPAGSGAFTLVIDGSGFVDGSVVQFGTARLIPLSITPRQIRVSVPATTITATGRIAVKVTSSAGDSNESNFDVAPPQAVTLTSLSPASREAGSGDFDLTITGQNLLPAPAVTFAGSAVPVVGTPSATTVTVRVPGVLLLQAGPKTVEVTVAGNTAASTLTVTVAIPPATISSAVVRVQPGGDTAAEVTLNAAALVPVTGRLELRFEPNASGTVAGFADPALMFVGSGGTTLDFTVPPGETRATLAESGRINVGTVAGTVVLSLTSLNAAGQPSSALPAPVRIDVPRAAPSLTAGSVRLTNSAGGVTVTVQGYSPSREVTSATIAFTIAAQTDVDGATSFTVPLQTVFQGFFDSAVGRANGSRFQLAIPFTVDGDANRITGVSVTLANGEGQTSLTGGR